MEKKIIKVERGDITNSRADAIVNAANNHLWMGAGVAGAIKRKGGDIIEREAVSKGPIPVGETVATTAGSLPNKYVIHAAAMGQDLVTDELKIAAATKNALMSAEELNLESIDFPALGTGVGGFPVETAAKIMVDAVKDFLAGSKSVQRVGFVLFDDGSFKAFRAELGTERKEI
ncbi:MAG: macro domain-containing protein [Candidatus Zixiibacteriota bacterium]|nr:MAG: macro domain-containing protein [candidate division Zixibacteria bacterium]